MARRYDFKAVTKSAPISTTTTFSGTDLMSDGVVAFHIGLVAGNNNGIDNVTRIRLKANAQTIVDLTYPFLRAFQQRLYKSNTASLATANASETFSIWLNALDAPTYDEADVCQFPYGANAQLEVTLGAGGAAPTNATLIVGVTETSVKPVFYPTILARSMNIPASQPVQTFDFTEFGEIRAIGMNTTGIDRAKLVLNGKQWLHMNGAQGTAAASDLLSETQRNEDVQTLTNPRFWRTPFGQNAAAGRSYIELATGAAWAGVANEIALWSLRGQGMGI